MQFAVTSLVLGGFGLLFAGVIWCFVFPAVQNGIGLEMGKWKATGLPTGAILLLTGVGLLYLEKQSSSAAPGKPEISETALLTADGQRSIYADVRCPFTVDLIGRVSVIGGEGNVTYRFVRQGFNEPEEGTAVRNFVAHGPGSHRVRDSYTFNVPEGLLYLEDRLEIMRPETLESEPVKMKVRCDAELPAGPPVPPPEIPGAGRP